MMVSVSAQTGNEMPITVMAGGIILSGIIKSNEQYCEWFYERMKNLLGNPSPEELAAEEGLPPQIKLPDDSGIAEPDLPVYINLRGCFRTMESTF